MAHTKRTITVEYLTEDSPFTQSDYLYYVGIDPSYSSTGLVILDGIHNAPIVNCHIKAGSPKDPFYVRIRKLLDALSDNLLHFNTDDIYVVMEGAAFASEFNAFKLGKLSGVIEYFLGEHKIAYSLVAPTFAKKLQLERVLQTKWQSCREYETNGVFGATVMTKTMHMSWRRLRVELDQTYP